MGVAGSDTSRRMAAAAMRTMMIENSTRCKARRCYESWRLSLAHGGASKPQPHMTTTNRPTALRLALGCSLERQGIGKKKSSHMDKRPSSRSEVGDKDEGRRKKTERSNEPSLADCHWLPTHSKHNIYTTEARSTRLDACISSSKCLEIPKKKIAQK